MRGIVGVLIGMAVSLIAIAVAWHLLAGPSWGGR